MFRFDLFEFYRFVLATLLGVYCVVRVASFLWRWQRYDQRDRWTPLVRRYVVVQLLRVRVRRFLVDILELGALVCVLVLLIALHLW